MTERFNVGILIVCLYFDKAHQIMFIIWCCKGKKRTRNYGSFAHVILNIAVEYNDMISTIKLCVFILLWDYIETGGVMNTLLPDLLLLDLSHGTRPELVWQM